MMLHGLVIKCGYTVVYETLISTIYSSNVFLFFERSEIDVSLTECKRSCKILPGSLILPEVFDIFMKITGLV